MISYFQQLETHSQGILKSDQSLSQAEKEFAEMQRQTKLAEDRNKLLEDNLQKSERAMRDMQEANQRNLDRLRDEMQ